jgi:uncharacterized membrane protein HdeD (DUF308 family)
MSEAIETPGSETVSRLRWAVIVTAIIGILVGIAVLIWPGHALTIVGILLGIGVIIGGLFRIATALFGPFTTGTRILLGVLGALITICGVIALFRPGAILFVLAIFIGAGWIIGGIHDLVAGIRNDYTIGPRWLGIVSAIVSIIAGIVVILLPGLSLLTFAIIAGIMLIIVSIAELASMPRR